MVADVEKQDTPLMAMTATEKSTLSEKAVNDCIERDDDAGIRRLLQEHGPNNVLRPRLESVQATSSLHMAAKKGALKCLQALLDAPPPPDILDIPDSNGLTPLMAAVSEAQPKSVQMLLKAGAHINARKDTGESSLHLLVFAIYKGKQPQETLQELADILVADTNIDLEPHNNSNMTPLAFAAERIPQNDGAPRNSGLITFCKKLVAAGASLRESIEIKKNIYSTIEEVLQQKKAHTAVLMGIVPPSSPPRPSTSEFLDMILLNKKYSTDDILNFLKNKSLEEARAAANCRLGSQTVLFRAIDKMKEPLVEGLLKSGARTWAFEINDELPIHRAIARGHYKILDHIVYHMKPDKKGPLDLKEYSFRLLQKLLESNRREKNDAPDVSHSKCLDRLMKDDVQLNFNQLLVEGNNKTTPLHLAASFNNQEALSKLLCHGSFLGARREVMSKDNGNVLPALLPSTLEHAMDGCIRHHKEIDSDETENIVSEKYTLRLDYSFLIPPVDTDSKTETKAINEMETLMEVSRSKRHRPAIKHPLVQTLLYAKWRKALPLYLFNLSIYLLFVALLTGFVYSIKDLRILEAKANNFLKATGSNNSTLEEDIDSKQTAVSALMAFIIPLTLYMVVREVFQIIFSYDTYLKSIENYLEWFLIIVVFVFCGGNFGADVTRHLAAWTMIIAWYEFVLILGRAPPLALYITMLRHVSWNFLKFIFLYGPLLLAFTVSFNLILQPSVEDDSEFSGFWTTLPKAIVMATGEFEYSDLNEHFSRQLLFLTSALLIFLLFLFLIFLVLMNVMNGLAITDTQEVVEDAILYSLMSRLELVYLIEEFFLKCPGMRSHVSKIHILSGSQNSTILRASINKGNKKERLMYGKNYDHQSKLDDDTSSILRDHRLSHIEEEDRQRRENNHCHCLEKTA